MSYLSVFNCVSLKVICAQFCHVCKAMDVKCRAFKFCALMKLSIVHMLKKFIFVQHVENKHCDIMYSVFTFLSKSQPLNRCRY
jgi:hypothetical protein